MSQHIIKINGYFTVSEQILLFNQNKNLKMYYFIILFK